jgi:prephenate dehydratase
MGLKRAFPGVRFLGSYPRAGASIGLRSAPRHDMSDLAFVTASDWLARCLDGRPGH